MDQTSDFEAAARLGFQAVRRTLAAVLNTVGADSTQPQEVSRRFGLDKTLTWKISRTLNEADMWSAATHLPGRAGLRTFVDALERGGARREECSQVMQAIDALEALIETHAGDRDTFEIMLAGLSQPLARRQAETFRKMAYRGNSAIWGVQASHQFSLQFVAPNAQKPDMLDIGMVSGLLDFRRLRPNTPWVLSTLGGTMDTDGGLVRSAEPIDQNVERGAVPLIRAFCSENLPPLRPTLGTDGRTRFELVDSPLGHTAAVSSVLGLIYRAVVPLYAAEADDTGSFGMHIYTPVETLTFDLYMHTSIDAAPTLQHLGETPGGAIGAATGAECGLLPLTDDVIAMGSPPDVTIGGMPHHEDLADLTARRMGHALASFRGYRLRMRYPATPSRAVFAFALPRRP